jgi:hypothetical protein
MQSRPIYILSEIHRTLYSAKRDQWLMETLQKAAKSCERRHAAKVEENWKLHGIGFKRLQNAEKQRCETGKQEN